jgi:hypothetical protein
MATSRRFSRVDADRILRRAAEIEGAGDETIERAIADVESASLVASRQTPVKKSGLVVAHLSTEREIPVGLNGDQLMQVVQLFPPYREGPAQVKLDEHEIAWHDGKGIRFAITSVGGLTEVHAYVSGFLFRRRRWARWVKAAADRLEILALLVAGQRAGGGAPVRARLPASDFGRSTSPS